MKFYCTVDIIIPRPTLNLKKIFFYLGHPDISNEPLAGDVRFQVPGIDDECTWFNPYQYRGVKGGRASICIGRDR